MEHSRFYDKADKLQINPLTESYTNEALRCNEDLAVVEGRIKGGWTREAIQSRIAYMREAVVSGIVKTEHLVRARWTIENLEAQL